MNKNTILCEVCKEPVKVKDALLLGQGKEVHSWCLDKARKDKAIKSPFLNN